MIGPTITEGNLRSALDAIVLDRDGSPSCLSEFWNMGLTAFVIVRRLGRIFCREQAKGLRALTGGAMLGRPVGNSRQLPSAAIIDADGRICFLKVAADAADHHTSEDLLWETARIAVEDSTLNYAAVMT